MHAVPYLNRIPLNIGYSFYFYDSFNAPTNFDHIRAVNQLSSTPVPVFHSKLSQYKKSNLDYFCLSGVHRRSRQGRPGQPWPAVEPEQPQAPVSQEGYRQVDVRVYHQFLNDLSFVKMANKSRTISFLFVLAQK